MAHALKVLVVARSTSAHAVAGGMERVLDQTASALRAAGFEVGLVTTAGGERPGWVSSDAPYVAVQTTRPGRYSLRWWLATARGERLLSGWAPERILGIGDAATSFAFHRRRVPLIVQAHGTSVDEMLGALALRSPGGIARGLVNAARIPSRACALRRSEMVVAVSDAVAVRLGSWPYEVAPNRLVHVPNAVDPENYQFDPDARARVRHELGLAASVPMALYAGRLDDEKGVDNLVRALATPSLDDWHLAVVGSGRASESLAHLVRELGLEARVHLRGPVNGDAIAEWYSAADEFVLPTRRREGMPMVVIEALANGLPVVTTELGAAPFGPTPGITITHHEPSRLADTMLRAFGGRGNFAIDEKYTTLKFDSSYVNIVRKLGTWESGTNA